MSIKWAQNFITFGPEAKVWDWMLWLLQPCIRADYWFAPSQWETALLCNDISHRLGANLESTLCILALTGRQQTYWLYTINRSLSSHEECFQLPAPSRCWETTEISNTFSSFFKSNSVHKQLTESLTQCIFNFQLDESTARRQLSEVTPVTIW